MSKEENVISDAKVKFRGLFDLNVVYANMNYWLVDIGYSEPKEDKYVEKVKPGGKDIEIVWVTGKDEDNGFFKFKIDIRFYATKVTEVESERDGNKLKLHKGDLWVYFNAKLVLNANNKWEEHGLMYKIYDKYIIRDKANQYKIELYDDVNKLIDELKNLLNLYNF